VPVHEAAQAQTALLSALTSPGPPAALPDNASRRALLLTALEAQRELLAADNASLLDANLVLRRHLQVVRGGVAT